jgi:uncharacterized protein YbaR (Trm112 family)
MTLQRYEEVPAVCQNKSCPYYRSFELVDVNDVKDDEEGNGYIICPECKQKISIE